MVFGNYWPALRFLLFVGYVLYKLYRTIREHLCDALMSILPASFLMASDSNQPTPPVRQNFKRVVRSTTPRAHPRLITLLLQRT